VSRLALALLAIAIPLVQTRIDALLGQFRSQHDVLYLWSGAQVRRLFPGLESVAADIYWLRTVQYFGGQRAFAAGKSFELLRPLIDITVTLDPRLEIAYRYGAIFLAEPPPVGAGQPQEAIALLQRGVLALPQRWTLRQDLAFYRFLYLKQPQEASRILTEASELPGAPAWFKNMAADLIAKGGDREAARRMWARIAQDFEGFMRANALNQIAVLDARIEADRLGALVDEFARRTGKRPESLGELRQAGLLEGDPQDAMGVPFEYERQTGRVSVSRRSPLWRRDSASDLPQVGPGRSPTR
jgi:hypothetical protein